MPRLNLKDDEMEEPIPLDSDKPIPPPPTLREVGGGGGGGKTSPLLLILVILVVLAGGVYALNYFKVIKIFGKKTPKIAEVMPEALPPPETGTTDLGSVPPTTTETPAVESPTPEPAPEPTPPPEHVTPAIPPSGSGSYTVQVSSWTTKAKADEEAARLSSAGYGAFVEDAVVGGENWFRVRVGRYGSPKEARAAAAELQKSMEDQLFVAKIGS